MTPERKNELRARLAIIARDLSADKVATTMNDNAGRLDPTTRKSIRAERQAIFAEFREAGEEI